MHSHIVKQRTHDAAASLRESAVRLAEHYGLSEQVQRLNQKISEAETMRRMGGLPGREAAPMFQLEAVAELLAEISHAVLPAEQPEAADVLAAVMPSEDGPTDLPAAADVPAPQPPVDDAPADLPVADVPEPEPEPAVATTGRRKRS